jgi:hypothetical protein
MDQSQKKKLWIFGALFGAWMGGVYALVSGAINGIFLPNIPVAPPEGGLALYLIEYALFGAFLGWISSVPENKGAGMALGGLATAIILVIIALTRTWGQNIFTGTLLYLSCTFLPLIVLMMPISLLIRTGVDAQYVAPDRPYLWARKYIIPIALTLLAVIMGSFSMYSTEQRQAITTVNQLVLQSKQAGSLSALPKPLQDVTGYLENAHGKYTLAWSDRVDTFFGPRPAGSELSQFLVIARFENGYAFACVFSSNRNTPNCVVY